MKQVLTCKDEGIEVCSKISNWAAILQPKKFQILIADRFPKYNNFKVINRDSKLKYLTDFNN